MPKGVSDFLPENAAKIGYIEDKVRRVFELWGFRRIITPLLEFHDVISVGLGGDLKERAFRFDDRQSGRLLAIPSDITPQVARIVATRMREYPLPHRLYYSGRVLRHAESQTGRSREIFQSGVELIGLDSPEADAEMIAMAVEVLKSLGIEKFRIGIGQVEFFRGIISSSGISRQAWPALQVAIGKKDVSAVRAILEDEPVSTQVKERILSLPRLFGGPEVLDAAAAIVDDERSARALENVSKVLEILGIYGVSDYLTVDLGEIRGLDYHTGVTFEGFVGGLGEAVCGGGRYDDLTARYGFAAPATGFAFNVIALLHALERQPEVEATKTRDILLFNRKDDRQEALQTAQHLRRCGYTVARDIIRRDFDRSLDYAKRMNILNLMVIGAEECDDDSVLVVRVADRRTLKIDKKELFTEGFVLKFPSEGESNG